MDALDLLKASNDKLMEVYIPAAVFVCVLVIVGIVGNIHVLVAYKMIQKMTAHRMFIMIMACIDLCNCTLHIPWAAYAALNPLTFSSDWGCKAMLIIGYWTGSSSGLVLGLICINYFRKLCRPLHRQISYRMVKLLCFVAIVIGAGMSWPVLVFYGRNEVHYLNVDTNATVIGNECGILSKYRNSMYILVFNCAVLAVSCVVCVGMVTLYIVIARAIAKHHQFQARHTREGRANVNGVSPNISSPIEAQGVDQEGHTKSSDNRVVSNVLRKVSPSRMNNDKEREASDVKYKKFMAQKKLVIMFSWISGIFLISYVLHQVMMLTVYLNPSIYSSMSDLQRSVFLVLLYFVYINVAVNWLIYARSDTQFRQSVILIYRNIGSRICCCRR